MLPSQNRRLGAASLGVALTIILFVLPTQRQRVSDFALSSADAVRSRLSPASWQTSSPIIPSELEDDDELDTGGPIVPTSPLHGVEEVRDPDQMEEPVDIDESDPLAYRHHLEAEHGAVPTIPESLRSTLGFNHIYVLSLAHRTDRRERMSKLARALGLTFTFVDATRSDSDVIRWIGERAGEVRARKKPLLAKAFGLELQHVGGMQIGTIWGEQSLPEHAWTTEPDDPIHASRTLKPVTRFRWPSLKDKRWGGKDWVEYLETSPLRKLVPKDPAYNVSGAMWDHLEANQFRQVNSAVHSTWYSQTRVMELMRKNGDETALVLEDDVDIEWDIERIWPNLLQHLPKPGGDVEAWDMAFLGHCWGREMSTYKAPSLHRSSEPRCLHGYAMSRQGYEKVTRLLRDPWIAYQTAVDTAIPRLIRFHKINAFSIDPPIIIQSKDQVSDIQSGIGSPWRGSLVDSTLNRIWRDEGIEVAELTDEQALADPASHAFRLTREALNAIREDSNAVREATDAAVQQAIADHQRNPAVLKKPGKRIPLR